MCVWWHLKDGNAMCVLAPLGNVYICVCGFLHISKKSKIKPKQARIMRRLGLTNVKILYIGAGEISARNFKA